MPNMIINSTPKDIRELSMTVEDEIARLIMKCLAKKPKELPADMIEAARILAPYADATIKSTVSLPASQAISDRTITIAKT